MDYKEAGVDVEAGYEAVELIKKHVKTTFDKNVIGDLGGFGGMYSAAFFKDMKEPVMVSGTDGVGTKIKYAFILNKHDTVGIDCVAMSVNDIVCSGAKPLFFLDYIAIGKVFPKKVEQIVKGVAEGCRQSGCALIGGETAEHPELMPEDDYDLAGFAVGVADKQKLITGQNIKAGDCLVGLASSGLHSNGYSLARKLIGENKSELIKYSDELGKTYAEEVLTPTRIYVKTVLSLIEQFEIKGIAHITGGGFIENIPRIFPKGIGATIDLSSYPLPPVFGLLKERSKLSTQKLYNTFNMGIGMVLCVNKSDAEKVVQAAQKLGEKAYIIGETVKGDGITLR